MICPHSCRQSTHGSNLFGSLAITLFFATAAIAQSPIAKADVLKADVLKADVLKADGSALLLFDGKTLKHWKVLNTDYFDKPGKVLVKEGVIELGKGMPATGLVYQGKAPTVDYELSLEARRVSGDDFFCGLTFPYHKQHATLILGGWGGMATGISNINDVAAIENETSSFIQFKNSQWYRVRLRVTDAKIEAWVDKEQIVDLKTEGNKLSVWWEQEPARPLGIATWHTAASLRNIRLKRIGKRDRPGTPSGAKPQTTGDKPPQESPKPKTPRAEK